MTNKNAPIFNRNNPIEGSLFFIIDFTFSFIVPGNE